jgi:hypothetical protein
MYYPKSQIQINLYTKGNQFQLVSSGEEYIGYYWRTSKNEYFTGRNPDEGSSLALKPILPSPPSTVNTLIIQPHNTLYNKLKNIDTSKVLLLPSYKKPSPTLEDYQVGNFTRYFAKKQTQILYIEISKDTFDKLKNQDSAYAYSEYTIFTLPWQISGDKEKVQQTNQKVISTLEKGYRIEGLHSYLNFNYLEFYK